MHLRRSLTLPRVLLAGSISRPAIWVLGCVKYAWLNPKSHEGAVRCWKSVKKWKTIPLPALSAKKPVSGRWRDRGKNPSRLNAPLYSHSFYA